MDEWLGKDESRKERQEFATSRTGSSNVTMASTNCFMDFRKPATSHVGCLAYGPHLTHKCYVQNPV
jgi:hypothetical protein